MKSKTKGATMQAYHGEQAIKDKLVAQMQAHYDADEIIHGRYWSDGKGCAVGCIAHAQGGVAHEKVSKLMDVPIQLAYLIDDLFEALPNGPAKVFPLRFLQAIRPGADLSRVRAQFAHWLLADTTHGMLALPDLPADVKGPTEKIAALLSAEGAGAQLTAEQIEEGNKAARAAWAARAARDARDAWAAWAARGARDAWDAWDAWAARDAWAAWAARDAWAAWDAWAARDAWAAWDARAARAAKREEIAKAQADKLIELLQAA